MPPEFCVEVLLATIILWVSIFGICDEALRVIEKPTTRISIYAGMGCLVTLFVYLNHGLTSCTLM